MSRPMRMKAAAILSLAATAALADDAGLLDCRAIADSAKRLACYDALPVAPRAAPGARPSAPSASAPAAGVPGGTPAPSASAAAPSPRQSLLSRFGFENRVQPDELPLLESHIPGTFEGWGPNSKITLANGQVWQISDGSRRVVSLENPKVTIRRGALGSFFLDFELSVAPRVRRIQ